MLSVFESLSDRPPMTEAVSRQQLTFVLTGRRCCSCSRECTTPILALKGSTGSASIPAVHRKDPDEYGLRSERCIG